jgi:3-hydroxymyristoyl/3-hydroxydecanoyl-(acyl carrier protein) dehydratase
MEADAVLRSRILEMVPQRPPFRFIEEILELDEEHIVGVYRFRSDEYFYAGHFPGLPVTPGVILIETMAQTGVVAFGLYTCGTGGVQRCGSPRRARPDCGAEGLFPRKPAQGRLRDDAIGRP